MHSKKLPQKWRIKCTLGLIDNVQEKHKHHYARKFFHNNIARRKWRFVSIVKPMSIIKQWNEDEHNR